MELMSLMEYIKSRPIEKDMTITNLRGCSRCHKLVHYMNSAFIMSSKIQGNNFGSYVFCLDCLPHWKKVWNGRKISSPDEWHFSTWDLDKPLPHTEVDRICLYLKRNQFYLQADFNPSLRKRNLIPEEIR